MNDAISRWLDLVFIIIFMIISCIGLNLLVIEVNKPLVYNHEDKSALYVENALYVSPNVQTGSDMMLALLVADDYIPYPASIRINNTPIIRLDDAFVTTKYTKVNQIYSTTGQWGLGNMLNKNVQAVYYISDADGDYWQYIIN